MKSTVAVFILLSSFILLPSAFSQGSLTPPGAPAPTMKTLDAVEARINIQRNGVGIRCDAGPNGDTIVRNTSGSNSGGNYSSSIGTGFGPLSTPSTATSPWANF